MNSNIITEKLDSIYNYHFDDSKAFEKVVNKQLNLVKYFNALLRDFKMLDCSLDIISINDHIQNEKKMELAITNADENVKKELEKFNSIAYPALKNAFLEKRDELNEARIRGKRIFDYNFKEASELQMSIASELDYVLSEMEEFVPPYLKEMVIDIIKKDEDFSEVILSNLKNDLPLFNFSVNISKNSFADIFMQKVIEKLIQTNDLDCIDELYSSTRDDQCVAILFEVMQEAQQEFAAEDVIDGIVAFDETIYNRAFEIFYEKIKSELSQTNGIFSEISKFLNPRVSGLYEFSKNFYEKYGNVIVLPLADLLRNSFIEADSDLKAYMESIKKDVDIFIVDIPKRLQENYYLNYSYSSAKKIDAKIKEIQ